jgi:hypothetical protein
MHDINCPMPTAHRRRSLIALRVFIGFCIPFTDIVDMVFVQIDTIIAFELLPGLWLCLILLVNC